MSPRKSMSWNSVKKLTVVSLGVLLALGEVTAQAEQYEAIYRPWQNADQEGAYDPIVIEGDDVVIGPSDSTDTNIWTSTADVAILATKSLLLEASGSGRNIFANEYQYTEKTGKTLTVDLESEGTIQITNGDVTGGERSVFSQYQTLIKINGNKTASQVTLTGDHEIIRGAREIVNFTGRDSSYTGMAISYAYRSDLTPILEFNFEPSEGSAAKMTGMLRSITYGSVSLTAYSGTTITGIVSSEPVATGRDNVAGNVTVNLYGDAVLQRGEYMPDADSDSPIPDMSDSVVGYAGGDTGLYQLYSNPGTTIIGDFESIGGANMSLSIGGRWIGDAVAAYGFIQKLDDSASNLSINVNGNWVGNIYSEAGIWNEFQLSPTKGGVADITVSGTWTGSSSLQEIPGHTITDAYGDRPAFRTYLIDDGVVNVTLNGAAALWNITKDSTVTDLTLQSGTIKFPEAVTGETFTGTTLTVVGDYTGSETGTGGTIAMNTVLAGDESATDKLVIKGNTSGNTLVTFTNVGGAGDQTVDGIEVIEVGGASDGTFTKPAKNYLRAGAYVYQLEKADGQNWYLVSTKQQPARVPRADDAPVLIEDDPAETDDPAADPGVGPADDTPAVIPATDDITNHIMRPEIGSYANNLYAANTLFTMSLYERLGETMYSDALRAKDDTKSGNFWLRAKGGHTRNKMEDGDLTTRGNWGVVQVGGDLVTWPTSDSHRFHVGLMAGYAHESSRTTSPVAGYSAKGKVSGYSVGIYGTWMNQKPEGSGPYADTWLMWSRFKNTVSSGNYTDTDTYHSKGFTLSIEGGYTFPLKDWRDDDGTDNAVRLQLQAQMIRMGVRDGAWTDAIGSTVQGIGAGNVRTRVGLKLYHQFTNDQKDRAWKPFIGLNWYHDTKAFGARIAGVADHIDGGRNFGEVKLGVEGKVKKNWNVWGFAGYQQGREGFRNLEALVGMKYLF